MKKQKQPQKNWEEKKAETETKENRKPFGFIENFTFVQKLKEKLAPAKTFIINMECNNGMHDTFMISTDQIEFTYMNASYVIDTNLKYYNINAKCYMLDYHQSFTLPIERKIPLANIKKAIKSTELIECETSTNPSTLQSFITSRIAEGIMKAAELDDFFKKIQMMLLITTFASVITVLLLLMKSGLLGTLGFG